MSINNLFNQTITVYHATGVSKFGVTQSSTGTAVKARVQKTSKQRLLPNNSLLTIFAVVYVPADTVVAVGDRVDYGTEKYQVFTCNEAVDGLGATHHIKLELTKWQTA